MKDYVLERIKLTVHGGRGTTATKHLMAVVNYANLLNEPPSLGKFVPCDLEGNVLSEPERSDCQIYGQPKMEELQYEIRLKQYQQAKDRVVFDGFRIENSTITNDIIGIGQGLTLYHNIESLLIDFNGDITLTPQAVERYKI